MIKEMKFEHGHLCWQESGDGPPLVLLHGWSMSHAVFSEIAELLANDFHLYIPDLPGHGASDSAESFNMDSFVRILVSWMEKLNFKQGNLLGWSLGGQVAMSIAAACPQLVKRLVLVSTTPLFCADDNWSNGLPQGELHALRRGVQRRYLATMGDFFDLQFKNENISEERRREILRFAVRPVGLPDPEVALLTLDLLGQEDLRPLLNRVEQQALVIHGENDRIIPVSAGRFLAEILKDAKLATLPGIGHAPFLSRPGQVAQLLRAFCL